MYTTKIRTILVRGTTFLLLISLLSIPIISSPIVAKQAVSVSQSSQASLQITETDLPDTIKRGEEYDLLVKVNNPGDSSVTQEVRYMFDDKRVFFKEITLAPGETERLVFLADLNMIEKSVGVLESGTYTHSFRTEDGAVASAEVSVISDPSGESTATATKTSKSQTTAVTETSKSQKTVTQTVESRTTGTGPAESAKPRRGFLTNGESKIPILSDTLNLTVLGFLLSIGGILHQLLSGA